MFKQVLLLLDLEPDCKVRPATRRSASNDNIPSHDPYIPRANALFYNCSNLECEPLLLTSLIQVTSPSLDLRACFNRNSEKYGCETIRYNHFKTVDKILFLRTNIPDKTFYTVDCFVYPDRGRVCSKKEGNVPHATLVDTASAIRPKEPSALIQDEFVCEESDIKVINCDIDPYVPFDEGLKLKESIKVEGDIVLNAGSQLVSLKKQCVDSWCGYSGQAMPTRRTWFERYDPPGGKVYRCYYAKRQQICKELYHLSRNMYNDRDWLNTYKYK